jgi:hypothetical protein
MVFEALVARVLSERLGEWIEGISPEALTIGVWRGDAQLSNLRLRPGALVPGKLPLVVHSGRIGRLTVQVPWANLSQPTVVELHGLDATLAIADAAQVGPAGFRWNAHGRFSRDRRGRAGRVQPGSEGTRRAGSAGFGGARGAGALAASPNLPPT